MANFTESATLLLKDKATKDINKVNKALRTLFTTAQKLKNLKIKLSIDGSSASKINQMATAVKALNAATKSSTNKRIGPSVNPASVGHVRQLTSALRGLNAVQRGATTRRIGSPVAQGDISKIRGLMNMLKQYNALLNRLSARKAATLPIPTVNQGKITAINKATAALARYTTALGALPRGGGRLPTPGVPGGFARGGGGGGRVPPAGGGGGGNLGNPTNWGQRMGSGFITTAGHQLAYMIQAAIVRGFATGTKQLDVGETRLKALGASNGQITAIQSVVKDISEVTEGRLTEGRLLGQAAELYPDITDTGNLKTVMSELARAQTAFMQTGVSAEEAANGAAQFVKAMTSQNLVFDDATGTISRDFAPVMDDFIKSMISGGVDMDPATIAAMARNMGALGKSATDYMRQFVFFMGEDVGTKAARGANQLQRQIMGGRITKKSKNALEDLGLVKNGEIIGKDQPDIARWASNVFLPAVEAQMPAAVREGAKASQGTEERKAYDDALTQAVLKVGLSTSGEEALTAFITQAAEFEKRRKMMKGMDVSQEGINENLGTSITANVDTLAEQFTSLLGKIGIAFETTLNPALTAAAGALTYIGNLIPKEVTPAQAAVGAAGVAAAGYGALKLGGAALGMLNPFTASSAVLTGSATSLTGAATALTGSAAALTRAAVALGASGAGVPGGAGAAAGGAGAAAAAGGKSWLKLLGQAAVAATGVLAIAGLIKPAAERVKEVHGDKPKEPRGTVAKFLVEKFPHLFEDKTLQVKELTVPEPAQLPEGPVPAFLEMERNRVADTATEQMRKVMALQAADATGPIPVEVISTPKSDRLTSATPTVDPARFATESAAATTPALDPARFGAEAAAPIDLAFVQGAGSLSTILTTGAQGIATAGTTAADAIAARGPSIGNIIGSAAAQSILAQVSNLKISVDANVKQSGGGVDTGGMVPQ